MPRAVLEEIQQKVLATLALTWISLHDPMKQIWKVPRRCCCTDSLDSSQRLVMRFRIDVIAAWGSHCVEALFSVLHKIC